MNGVFFLLEQKMQKFQYHLSSLLAQEYKTMNYIYESNITAIHKQHSSESQ